MQYEQLKAGRLKATLTQKQAAERLGVSQPYLSQLEKGDRPVTVELAWVSCRRGKGSHGR